MARSEWNAHTPATLLTKRSQQEFFDPSFSLPGSFGVRVNRGGRRVFFLVYRTGNRRKRIGLGTYPLVSLAEARERAAEVLSAVEHARELPYLNGRKIQGKTFGTLSERFVAEHVSRHCSKKTAAEYNRLLEREILPFLSERPLGVISAWELSALIDDIAETRGKAVLAQRVRALLSKMFSFAKTHGLVEENPLLAIASPKPSQKNIQPLSLQELSALLEVASRQNIVIHAALTFLILTGARVSPLLSLRWADVRPDFLLFAAPEMDNRKIFLAPEARSLLRELGAITGHAEHVFVQPSGSRLKDLRRVLIRISSLAGIEAGRANTQNILRSVEAALYRLRVRSDVIDYILGRVSSTTLRKNIANGYDYSQDAKSALFRWAEELRNCASPSPRTGLRLVR